MSIKAIETYYAGCRFRSRLEARWAVFFDTLGIPWEYETQGYWVGVYEDRRRRYLPDFWLPETETWVEVKGAAHMLDFELLADAIDFGHGLPAVTESEGTTRGLLLLGPIPRVSPAPLPSGQPDYVPGHPILQHHKGGLVSLTQFRARGLKPAQRVGDWPHEDYFDSSWGDQRRTGWTRLVADRFLGTWGYVTAEGSGDAAAYRAARSARFEHGESGR